MNLAIPSTAPLAHPDRLFIDGDWVVPSSAETIGVIDSATGEQYFRAAAASPDDIFRAIKAARRAFDAGPWPRMTHAERASYMRAIAAGVRERSGDIAQLWPRESGGLHKLAGSLVNGAAAEWDYYAGLAETFSFEERVQPTAGGEFGLLVYEPVGVVAAIIPWNGPVASIAHKAAPALLAGCTMILKSSPEAPGEGLIMAEIAEAVGLPAGVFNVIVAEREASELLVTDPRVDKIAFTGSTAAGRRIGALCGERIARCSLELGGKSAAVILEDADIEQTASTLAAAECLVSGQVCASLTRIIVPRRRHDAFVDALGASFSQKRVGDPFDAQSELGPLASERQRDRVEAYIAKGRQQGATLVTGGGRPNDLARGYYVEPTVFADVDNDHVIAREEIFGPVLSVIRASDEADAVRIANDSIYGLNASVFTEDVDRARQVAGQLRSGTVGHNAMRIDFGIAFGGFKQSGIGREGGLEGLRLYLEPKTVILDGTPTGHHG